MKNKIIIKSIGLPVSKPILSNGVVDFCDFSGSQIGVWDCATSWLAFLTLLAIFINKVEKLTSEFFSLDDRTVHTAPTL